MKAGWNKLIIKKVIRAFYDFEPLKITYPTIPTYRNNPFSMVCLEIDITNLVIEPM
jgi:hypothetical protein